MTNIQEPTRLIAISGKIAAGKDTVGKALMMRLGQVDYQHAAFADQLKTEITHMVKTIMGTQYVDAGKEDAAKHLKFFFPDISFEERLGAVELLWQDALDGKTVDGFTRTDGVRATQQYWGTDIRRKYQDNYWVAKFIENITPSLKSGKYVLNTDVRFKNEADAVIDNNGIVIRLDISREVQAKHLLERDGTVLTPEKEFHPSETDLDDYDRFSLRIDNSPLTPNEAVDIILRELPSLLV